MRRPRWCEFEGAQAWDHDVRAPGLAGDVTAFRGASSTDGLVATAALPRATRRRPPPNLAESAELTWGPTSGAATRAHPIRGATSERDRVAARHEGGSR